jgi:tetratricopeptide (TPR) repeat protein
VAAAAAIAAFVPPAYAQPAAPTVASEPDPAKKQRAQEHIRVGTEAFEKKDYETAIAELNAAYDEVHEASLLYAIGQAYRVSGDCTRAARAYRAFLGTNPPGRQREAAQENLERCESAAPAPAPRPAEKTAPAPSLPAPPVPPAPVGTPPAPPAPPAPEQATLATAPAPGVSQKAWYQDVPGGIFTATGGVSLIVGVVLFAGGRSQVADADAVKDDGAFGKNRGDADDGLTQQRVGLVAMGAGGALVTAGILRYVSVSKETKSASLRIAPAPLGMTFAGTF